MADHQRGMLTVRVMVTHVPHMRPNGSRYVRGWRTGTMYPTSAIGDVIYVHRLDAPCSETCQYRLAQDHEMPDQESRPIVCVHRGGSVGESECKGCSSERQIISVYWCRLMSCECAPRPVRAKDVKACGLCAYLQVEG